MKIDVKLCPIRKEKMVASFLRSQRRGGIMLWMLSKQVPRYFFSLKNCMRSLSGMKTTIDLTSDVGQPSPKTHPELLTDNEIMPGIRAADFALRRKALTQLLPKESLVIISSASVKQMSQNVPYPFHQDADFLYYTGCQQPGGLAVFSDQDNFCMFMPDPDPDQEAWSGRVAGVEEALNFFKADEAYYISQLHQTASRMIDQSKRVYIKIESSNLLLQKLPSYERAVRECRVHDLRFYTDRIRWVKSEAEISLMRNATAITCQAFLQTMKASKVFRHENILAATIEYECRVRGAQSMAFPPVVGAGVNSTIIHYLRHDQQVREGEMVLMDAGCKYYGYASDVTRTWPPSGSFSVIQRVLYEIVLSTMKECFKLCHPGSSLQEIHQHSADLLFRELLRLGVIKGSYQKNWCETYLGCLYADLNPTSIGHYLGLDVHDSSTISKACRLKPGVIITIEPGLYIPAKEDIPTWFHGIGIRIEDDVLITENGHEVLSSSVPKEVEEIEALLN